MKLLQFSLSDTLNQLKTVALRFPVTLLAIIALAIQLAMNLHKPDAVSESTVFFTVLLINTSLFIFLLLEKRKKDWLFYVIQVAALFPLWFVFKMPDKMHAAEITQFLLLNTAFMLGVIGAHHINKSDSQPWWQYAYTLFIQAITIAIFASILMAGLSLVLVSLENLFNINIPGKSYSYLAIFCYVLFALIYFLSKIPQKTSESIEGTYPNIYKILGLYILLPILAIYLMILYVYLLKIIFTWTLPVGWVSWLVSILGFGAFITMVVLYPLFRKGENKIVQHFFKIFPMLFLPLLALMLVGLIRRFSDYGITINRLLVLIMNLWFWGASLFLIFSKSKQLKWLPLSLGLVALLAGFDPWSITNVTKVSLHNEFKSLLSEANWQNNKESEIKTLSEEQQMHLVDIGNYLESNYGAETIRPLFSALGEESKMVDLTEQLRISETRGRKNVYFYTNAKSESFVIDLRSYNRAISLQKAYGNNVLYKSDSLNVSIDNEILLVAQGDKKIPISLAPLIEELGQIPEFSNLDQEELTIEGTDYKLHISKLHGEFRNKGVDINYLDGLLLLK